MTPEIGKTYLLRNGTRGLVEELLNDGTFYGTVTAPPTDLRVRVIWDKEGVSTKRGTHWDLVGDALDLSDDELDITPGRLLFIPDPASDQSRIASALERIADYLESKGEKK